MYAEKTIFSQLTDCLPWSTFARLGARYGGDYDVRTFPCVERYRAMASVLTAATSALLSVTVGSRHLPGTELIMSIEDGLQRVAADYAAQVKQRETRLQAEVIQLEIQTIHKKIALNTARLASNRRLDFQVRIGIDYQCPRCWIDSERRSALFSVGGGTRHENFFRCHTCDYKFTISVTL